MSHGDAVMREPEGFRVTAHTDVIPIAAMEDPERGLYSPCSSIRRSRTRLGGQDVLKRFLYDGCGLLPDWTPVNIIERRGRTRSARRSATPRSSAPSPEASTRRSRRSWCIAPSAISSPASSSITG